MVTFWPLTVALYANITICLVFKYYSSKYLSQHVIERSNVSFDNYFGSSSLDQNSENCNICNSMTMSHLDEFTNCIRGLCLNGVYVRSLMGAYSDIIMFL
mmetsp:Transcript_19802/g.39103  ORF Transcript_19802/g.39103 Transcript_19802/m.39103 type:complete len:100 (-) Transcript_19802:30-329(-)